MGQGACVDLMAVHSLVTAAQDKRYLDRINTFEVVAPDGQPVRWALNYFYRAGLKDRVYGPEFTIRLCKAAAEEGVSVYLFGGTEEVLAKFAETLRQKFPKLQIAGMEAPPFRPLTPEEDAAVINRVNASGAGLMFIGIGCPKQEHYAFEHRHSIRAVQLCVGAAFDFHAGVKKMAPAWMQKRGLEWLYRLVSEPGRLWKRYLVTNSIYVMMFLKKAIVDGRTPKGERPMIADVDEADHPRTV
jgi:exopolysaccharide biosynthesis WecB/TagA/CpsF family protein